MHTLLTGEIGGGQSTAIIGRQELSALDGIGAGRAPSRGNTVLLHGRVFTTATGQRLGGLSFTAYISWAKTEIAAAVKKTGRLWSTAILIS